MQHSSLSGQYQIVVSREDLLDQMEVRCELQLAAGTPGDDERRRIAAWVQDRIKAQVGLTTEVSVLANDTLERTLTGKAKRVIDKRPR